MSRILEAPNMLQENQSVAEKESIAGNQPVEKEFQSAEKAAKNNLPKSGLNPKDYQRTT